MLKGQLPAVLCCIIGLLIKQAVWSNRDDVLRADYISAVQFLSGYSNNTDDLNEMAIAGSELVEECNHLVNSSDTNFRFFELIRNYLEKFYTIVTQTVLSNNVTDFLTNMLKDNDTLLREINATAICDTGLYPLYHKFIPSFIKLETNISNTVFNFS